MEKYTLTKMSENERNKFNVTIKADSNDADYITTTGTYSKKDFDEFVINELIHLKKYSNRHELEDYEDNGYSEYLDIPYNGHDGYCHTLTSVKVEYIDGDGEVWTVNY